MKAKISISDVFGGIFLWVILNLIAYIWSLLCGLFAYGWSPLTGEIAQYIAVISLVVSFVGFVFMNNNEWAVVFLGTGGLSGVVLTLLMGVIYLIIRIIGFIPPSPPITALVIGGLCTIFALALAILNR